MPTKLRHRLRLLDRYVASEPIRGLTVRLGLPSDRRKCPLNQRFSFLHRTTSPRAPNLEHSYHLLCESPYAKNALDVLSVAVKFYYLSRELPLPRLFENVTVKVPKVPKQFWRPSQYAQLVASASTPEQRVAILLMGDCGLRRGEVIALEWSHIHREPKPHIVVQRSCSGGHWGPTKGGRPRTVPMTTRLVQALDQLPRSIRAPWVLPRVPGGEQPHTSHSLSWLVAMVERNAGLGVEPPKRKDGKGKRSPWGQLHRLRHTYGTRLAAAGVSARNIQELMGHEDLKTSAIYIHLIEGAQDSAVAELEAFDHAAAAATEAVAS